MKARNLTYRALADATHEIDGRGLTHAHINMLANARDKPSDRAMELIAQACDVEAEHFAEYRLSAAMRELDPDVVGFERALETSTLGSARVEVPDETHGQSGGRDRDPTRAVRADSEADTDIPVDVKTDRPAQSRPGSGKAVGVATVDLPLPVSIIQVHACAARRMEVRCGLDESKDSRVGDVESEHEAGGPEHARTVAKPNSVDGMGEIPENHAALHRCQRRCAGYASQADG